MVPILIALTLPLALVAGVAVAAKAPAWVLALIFLGPGALVVFKLLNDALRGQLTVMPTRIVARAGAQQLLRAVPVAGITQIELASSNLRPGFGSIKALGWGRLWFGPVRSADKAYQAAVEATLAIQPEGEAGAMAEAAAPFTENTLRLWVFGLPTLSPGLAPSGHIPAQMARRRGRLDFPEYLLSIG